MDRAARDTKPAKSRRRKNKTASSGIWNHAIIAIGVAGVGLLFASALIWWQLIAGTNSNHAAQHTASINSTFVGYFNGRIAALKTQVAALANAKETVAALVSYDEAVINAMSARLTDQTGFAQRISIIPKGKASVDLNSEVPISFAALDLIKRAETQAFVGPEVSLNQQDLAFAAQPITQEGVVVGVLFVAFDKSSFFFTPLTHMDSELGQVTILQRLEGSPETEIFKWSDSPTPGEVVTTQLSANHWQLVFQPNLNSIEPVASLLDLLSSVAMIMGFLLAGILFAFSSLTRKLQADAQTLADYISRLLRGRAGQLENYQLPAFQQLAAGFAKYSKSRPGAPGRRPSKPAGRAARATPDELLDDADEVTQDQVQDEAEEVNSLLDNDNDKYLQVNVADDATENFGIEVSEDVGPVELGLKLSPEIFRAYDIRGITTKNLTEDVVHWIGRAFAAEALALEQTKVAVGRDGRHSSVALKDALLSGLTEGGVDVLDIGEVPTPLLYFATHAMDTGTGIMITGSHNPPDYNGLKMVLAGQTLADDRIQALRERIENNQFSEGSGEVEEIDLNDHYIDRVLEDVVVAQPCKVVVDCGNGVAGLIAPRLIEELGCEVVPLYCDVDGDFPNHHPDPADPKNLEDLIAVVKDEKAQLGLAFDGDGDRLGVVTAKGEIIWPDKLLMLFAQDIVGRNPGADIIFDVKCSRHLNTLISEYGGRPIMWKTGHSHMKAKLKETGALLAGEFSGHICFGERWYGFDDALYSAARLLEIVGGESRTVEELFEQFPATYSTPELKIETSEKKKFQIVEQLAEQADWGDGAVTDIDGVRVDYADGWGLIRASNTSPMLTLRFEADCQAALDRIRTVFQDQLSAIDPALTIG